MSFKTVPAFKIMLCNKGLKIYYSDFFVEVDFGCGYAYGYSDKAIP